MNRPASGARENASTRLPEEQIHDGVGEGNENFGPTVRSLAFAIFWLILFWCWALYPIE